MVDLARAAALTALLGVGALAIVVGLSQDAEAETYWAVGVNANAAAAGPPQGTTTVAITNWGVPGAATATMANGAGVPTCVAVVNQFDTGLCAFGEQIVGTQITNVGPYSIDVPYGVEVNQLTTVYGASATTDGTRLLHEGEFGTRYNIGSWEDPGNSYVGSFDFSQGANFITIIAIKESTTVTVTVTRGTAASAGCPVAPCAPGQVPAIPMGGSWTTQLGRGQALQLETNSVYSVSCYTSATANCVGGDLTGSVVTASTPVAVFVGATCVNMQDSSCDLIYDQALPENTAGEVYVLCSQSQDLIRAGQRQRGVLLLDFNGRPPEREMMRIRALSGTATVTFSSPTISPGPVTSMAFVTSTGWSTFYYNQDVVVRSDAPIQLVNYMASLNLRPAVDNVQADPVGYAYYSAQDYGDPSMAYARPIEAGSGQHWFYSDASWEAYVAIGAPLGDPVSLNDVILTGQRSITGDSEYGCTQAMLADASAGVSGTHHIENLLGNQMTAQVLGLGFATSYLYDVGGQPLVSGPPEASFIDKPVTTGCGMRENRFFDMSTDGTSPIVSYQWDFGDGYGSTVENPTHTYAAPGDYLVTETVTDANGLQSSYALVVTAVHGGMCPDPGKSQDDGMVPRPPRDSVDPEIAEDDYEPDGVPNYLDNCVYDKNPSQEDMDEDGAGDACDPDDDNDGVLDGVDNCRVDPNPAQANLDLDIEGDACDDDMDGDAVLDDADNCRLIANADQADKDGDDTGDACDEALAQVVGRTDGAPDARGVAGASAQQTGELPWVLIGMGAFVLVALAVGLALLRRRA